MLECVLMGLNGFDEVFSHLVILSHFEGIPDGFADQIFGKRRKVTDNAGIISYLSPFAKNLISKSVGDTFEMTQDHEVRKYLIESIEPHQHTFKHAGLHEDDAEDATPAVGQEVQA